jgi:superfamily I DNA/RNA helicase
VPQSILDASADILRQDKSISGLQQGVKITISALPTAGAEAEFIARQIEDLIGGLGFFSIDSKVTDGNQGQAYSLSDFAVLVRTRGQFDALEKAFRDHNLPYQVVGTEPFYLQEPYVRIIDAIKFMINPQNPFVKNKVKDIIHIFDHIDNSLPLPELISQLAKFLKIDVQEIEKLIDLSSQFSENKTEFLQFSGPQRFSVQDYSGRMRLVRTCLVFPALNCSRW